MSESRHPFKVIQGGPNADVGIDLQTKLGELRRITHAIQDIRRQQLGGARGPRYSQALWLGLLACGAAFAAIFAIRKLGWILGDLVANGIPVLSFFVVYVLVVKFSAKHLTYTSRLDELLANYDPVDRHAFRALQARTERFGWFEPSSFLEWVDQERQAIDTALGTRPTPKRTFLNRKI